MPRAWHPSSISRHRLKGGRYRDQARRISMAWRHSLPQRTASGGATIQVPG
jgi:hypothetical protein